MSERSQIVIVWWSLAFAAAYGFSLAFLLHMMGPPSATLTAVEVARFYTAQQTSILIGATVCSWTGMSWLRSGRS